MRTQARFLVLSGVGINCEKESAQALSSLGIDTKIVHLTALRKSPRILRSYQGLYLPGGFSFGDDLGSGKVLSLIIEQCLKDEFCTFVDARKPILGVCNGFQVLVQLGLLPKRGQQCVSLIPNKGGHFLNTWVNLEVTKHQGPWFNQCPKEVITLPIRHGEGRMIFDKKFFGEKKEQHTALKYTHDINGSCENIAALTDETGLILGMMPHPEAAVDERTSPLGGHLNPSCDGKYIFKSIANYLKQS